MSRSKILLCILLVCAAAMVVVFLTTPLRVPGHSTDGHADVIIVLGCPANDDGTASPCQRQRALAGVQEYRSGVAPRILFTGGAAHNAFVESHGMTWLAVAQGVPARSILQEDAAINTVQNAQFSLRIMQANGWHSADVVALPSQLRRAALIFAKLPIDVRMHSSGWPPEASTWDKLGAYALEVPKTDLCRVGFCGHERLLHLLNGR
jgi:uncharacterized SAM-binding protein YcdF (DUF218 family)